MGRPPPPEVRQANFPHKDSLPADLERMTLSIANRHGVDAVGREDVRSEVSSLQFLHDGPSGSSRGERFALCARIPIFIFTRPDFTHSPGLPYSLDLGPREREPAAPRDGNGSCYSNLKPKGPNPALPPEMRDRSRGQGALEEV